MLLHAGIQELDIEKENALEPVRSNAAFEESVPQIFEPMPINGEKLVGQATQKLKQDCDVHQRKVTVQDPHSSLANAITEESEYEASDEKSPNLRKQTKRSAPRRPQSAKLQYSSRPDSAKVKQLQSTNKNTSYLLDALLSGQGCPGPSIQAEALEASRQGQLTCLLRLSVFIWPMWIDEVVGITTNKVSANSGVVLEMSHQEVIHQLNSLCQAQESGQNKNVGQSDATVHHMVNICVKRCSELLRAHDYKTTKQILQNIIKLSRRMASTARNQLKLLPLKLISAMLHIGDGNIRDAVFELRSTIESIPVDQSSVKPFISTDVAVLYNHLSYYYSLLGSRVEACRYTKMGIDIMAENKSTMARSDMSTQYLSVDEVSARHQYMEAVLMMNQVVAEVSKENADMDAAKALCSDAVMFLEEAGTCKTCVSHLTTRLHPLFEGVQKVLDGKTRSANHSQFAFSPGAALPVAGRAKATEQNRVGFTGSDRVSKLSTTNETMSGCSGSTKNAKTQQSKHDLSTSFGLVRSQSQIFSVKTPKTRTQPLISASRPPSGVKHRMASPKTNDIKSSKFKMLMLGPALAQGHEIRHIPSLLESSLDKCSTLPESLIRALFPPSYLSSKILLAACATSTDVQSPDIFDVESNVDLNPQEAFENSASILNSTHGSENEDKAHAKSRPDHKEHQSTNSNATWQRSEHHTKFSDTDSLRICCNLIQSFTCSFDSVEEASQQHIKLATHCALKLACEICYLFKLNGKSTGCTQATTILSSGKQVSANLAQGGIIATQMNRFLQNGVLMRPVVILDEDNFTDSIDDLDRVVLPSNAGDSSIMMGVIPGYSQFNRISGFIIAIRSSPAASFDPKELLICEILCNCCSQSLPLL
jgi:hypothetical protein